MYVISVDVREQAKAVGCMSNLRRWSLFFYMYTDDHEGEFNTGRGNDMRRFCYNRHKGFANCLYLDFSVRKTGLKELW